MDELELELEVAAELASEAAMEMSPPDDSLEAEHDQKKLDFLVFMAMQQPGSAVTLAALRQTWQEVHGKRKPHPATDAEQGFSSILLPACSKGTRDMLVLWQIHDGKIVKNLRLKPSRREATAEATRQLRPQPGDTFVSLHLHHCRLFEHGYGGCQSFAKDFLGAFTLI